MTTETLPRGPLMCGVESIILTDSDRRRLCDPRVGGVILFARNVETPGQLIALCDEIRALRSPPLVIGIDQEGGRVQRLRGKGFIDIPPMRRLGEHFAEAPEAAEQEAYRWGALMGGELRCFRIDFSFAPVLDLDYGKSAVIGDRAFAASPETVVRLAGALQRGLKATGCAAVGKHFPGHGWVEADSHHDLPVDARTMDAIEPDLVPYRALIADGLEAVMMAHVKYPAVDPLPAGYSAFWVHEMLRGRLGFDGLVFSDDLGMAGAALEGGNDGWAARADAALAAGCDVVLACNDFAAIDDMLTRWRPQFNTEQSEALVRRWQAVAGQFHEAARVTPFVDAPIIF
ncbi:MAG: beta-N-acetylhexosaminidase [Proteobacteria bacterium]|nr:beta-N-acetylhexosaminidase [Pseudomonadota bacterium]MCL2310066.1 beta-N-acetylhexosaminidase [Pseudomonadota bacterium]